MIRKGPARCVAKPELHRNAHLQNLLHYVPHGSFWRSAFKRTIKHCRDVDAQPKPLEAEEEAGVDSEISTTGTHILLSGSAPAYREIAERLNQSMAQPTTVHTLSGVAQDDDAIVEAIRQSADRQVVAVGLRAATAARRLGDKRVVFCQVVNYRDHDLVSDNMKGVSALPSREGPRPLPSMPTEVSRPSAHPWSGW